MARSNEFVTVSDGRIVDGRGRRIQLRGVGLGNWLLPEGYMWRLSPGRESPRQIEALITELVGEDRAEVFWRRFLDNFITQADIARIAAEGFNHVRLPINWRHIIDRDGSMRPDGLGLIDRVVEWCADQGMWVLLDLHGAPGGQTGTNIDDSNGRPELFMDGSNEELTITLWRELAIRYRDNTTVLGYDLLNEPLPNEWQHVYPEQLVDLYRRLTEAIREVDSNHIIMYEGTHWANNWDIFTEVWDANSVLQFHKYWSPPDLPSIQRFLDIGAELGLPVFMGEGGENNLDWLATAFQLFEDIGIGWNFWPWKKIDTITSPCSVVAPPGWEEIAAYGNGQGPAPSPTNTWNVLDELLSNMALDRCRYNSEVINALFHRAPLTLPATSFGFRGPSISYQTQQGKPLSGFRENDAVTIVHAGQANQEAPTFDHNDGRARTDEEKLTVLLQPGEWVSFDLETPRADTWVITVVTDAAAAVPPQVTLDSIPLATVHAGDGHWQSTTSPNTSAGPHEIRIEAGTDTIYLDRLQVHQDRR